MNGMNRISKEQLSNYSLDELKTLAEGKGVKIESSETTKEMLVKEIDLYLQERNRDQTHYNLIANICHQGKPENLKGNYRAHVWNRATKTWYDMQDLHVEETLPELVTVSEAYIQIWERQDVTRQYNRSSSTKK